MARSKASTAFCEGLIGAHLIRRTFWFFGSVFIFILATNWVGLIPGVGSMGWGQQTAEGFRLEEPFFRGANADVNLTLAMALVFFASWIVWGLREVGPVGFIKELFAPKGESTGPLKLLLIVVFFAAGCLEVISILFRPISLSFRLYGNIFAGETMLETMARVPARRLAGADSVLLHGIARRAGTGAGVHAVDGGVHAADLSASREDAICRRTRPLEGTRRTNGPAICTSDSRRSAPPSPSAESE